MISCMSNNLIKVIIATAGLNLYCQLTQCQTLPDKQTQKTNESAAYNQASNSSSKDSVIIFDFENKRQCLNWWKDNNRVTFAHDTHPSQQLHKFSKGCMHIVWDSIPENSNWTWFTDIKADTFVSPEMNDKWKNFKNSTWMSFWYKSGDGDTVYAHPLVLSKGHRIKWGSTKVIPLGNKYWTFVKVKFSELTYEDWGKDKAPFDLNGNEGRCFEIGLRVGSKPIAKKVELWIDNVKITNYEPFE